MSDTELDLLAAEAGAVDAETLQAAPVADAAIQDAAHQPAVDPVESLAGFLQIAAVAAGYAGFSKAAMVWQPNTCRGLADKAVPVLVKYPWGQRILAFLTTGAGVEEMALLAFAAPLAMATWQAVGEDLKQKQPVTPAAPQPLE